MTDPALDFRYTIGDKTVEGIQITESTRYQDKLWPDWLSSKDFLTIDGNTWIVINGEEIPLPPYAWLVRSAAGQISIVDALDFEHYNKVVPHAPLPAAVALAAVPDGLPPRDDELLLEVKVAFELLQMDQYDEALKNLRNTLAARAQWCDCAPGICDKLDQWGCRQKSPLVKKPRKPRKKSATK